MIRMSVRGSSTRTEQFLQNMKNRTEFAALEKFGAQGVSALQRATPRDTGKIADSWYYEIVQHPGYFAIHWLNSYVEDPGRIPIAAIIQYGHGTRRGGYVQGRDYINPAMRPIFDQIVSDMWKEVTK